MYVHICCLQNELDIVADGVVTLETFCKYQKTVNPPGDDNLLHFDYAILITGYANKIYIELIYSTAKLICLCYIHTYLLIVFMYNFLEWISAEKIMVSVTLDFLVSNDNKLTMLITYNEMSAWYAVRIFV